MSTSNSTVALNFAVTLRLSCSIKFCWQVRQEDSPSVVPSWSSAKVLQLFRVLMENMTSPQKMEISFFLCVWRPWHFLPIVATSFLDDISFLNHICVRQRLCHQYCELKETNHVAWWVDTRNGSNGKPYCSLHEQNCCARNSFAIYNKNLQQHIRFQQ